MKTIWKRLACVSAVLLTAMTLLLPVSAQRQFPDIKENCRVYDVADYLTDDEEEELTERIRETADHIDMYFAIVIVGRETHFNSDTSVMNYADNYYDKLFNPEQDVDTDGLLLVINNSTKYDYVTTSGMGQFYYTNADNNNRVEEMLEDITSNLNGGRYLQAAKYFCTLTERNYDKGVPKRYYIEDFGNHYGQYAYLNKNNEIVYADRPPYNWLGSGLVFLLIGLVAAVITGLCIKHAYRFKKAVNPTNYICKNNTILHESTDTFLRQYTTKVRMESSGGGGGGGGGGHSHSSSGGHSHGGGGHHR